MENTDLLDSWLKNRAMRDALSSLRALATEHSVEILISRAGVDVRPMPNIVTTIDENKQHDRREVFAKQLKV